MLEVINRCINRRAPCSPARLAGGDGSLGTGDRGGWEETREMATLTPLRPCLPREKPGVGEVRLGNAAPRQGGGAQLLVPFRSHQKRQRSL